MQEEMYNAVSRFDARMPFTISVSVFSNTIFAIQSREPVLAAASSHFKLQS
jgi:hypothetical protein